MAVPQVPLTWLTTNTWIWLELSMKPPTALQLPADAHDTEPVPDPEAVPGTAMAVPQVPLTWLTTNAAVLRELSRYCPPALQLPAEAHDTEVMKAVPWLR